MIAEELTDVIVLRAGRNKRRKLSWEETARAMGRAKEDWLEWDCTSSDGLHDL